MKIQRIGPRLGLTLIELLLTLSTLSIFTGVLASGLTREREDSRTTHCLKNLKTIMQTALTYAENDPDCILGPVGRYANDFVFEGYAEYGGGPGTMIGSGPQNYFTWGHEFGPRTRPFNQMLYGFELNETISPLSAPGDPAFFKEFQCPGWDQGWQNWPGWFGSSLETESSYFKGSGTSFRMNNLPYDDGSNSGIYYHSRQRIPVPAQTVSFMEARVFQTLFTNDVWQTLSPGELTSYHNKLGFFNVAYSDGHASFADFGDGTYYQHLDWTPHTEWTDLDARGTWGRMDCLPEPPVGSPSGLRGSRSLEPQGISLRRVGS